MSDASDTSTPQVENAPKRDSWVTRYLGDFRPVRVLGGFVLSLLVVLSAAGAVTFFAAAQFQSRIAELSLKGAPLTIWRIDQFREDFKNWPEAIRKLREGIAQDKINLAKDKQNNLVLAAEQLNEAARLAEDVRSLKQKITTASGQLTSISTTSPPESTSTVPELLTQLELLLSRDDLQKQFGSELAQAKKRYIENIELRATVETNKAKITGKESWIASLQEQRQDREQAAAKLFGDSSSTTAPELVERILNVTAELSSLSSVWGGAVYTVALWTNDMVVLSLLISMGVLGSALNLLAAFISNDQDSLSFGEYPLRLAFGAVLAIVMFIIAKAGVPVLADTGKLAGNAPLNPYFISLLAVVSGLMSDRSMAAIRGVASSLLRSVGGADYSPRYSRLDLDEALKATNRDIAGMARLLELDVDDVQKLFSGNDKVSPDQQKLVSAYLGLPLRDLFSDLPAT
ncbi:hypothetical protein QA639_34360 [Bradyrhizobium pachyrhizi]|uniref:hypothetical protein n=1 Tax=Bradyrhizobium pachyrhizi TaxID=280333 RepID=UPI0024B18371|nr:hypothetical protein [Bradyrhizobium pachyrhizi]WFU54636.1 hypothetical protein QA639_34360 [Bradyrhizobium pachyrhizi]